MKSIRFKIFAFMAVLLVLLLVMLNIVPMSSSRDLVFEEKESSLSGRAAMLASSLSGLERITGESAGEVLGLLDVDGYDRIIIADETGSAVYDSAPDGGGGIADVADAVSGNTVFRSSFKNAAFSSSFAMPVATPAGIMGAVYLYEYDSERAEIMLDIQGRILTVSVVIGIASVMLSVLFSEVLMYRLKELVRSMRIVAGGDYKYRLSVHGQDEISELGEEFNALTARLEDTEKQRRRFVSDASHELKTPLASIRLLADSIIQNDGVPMDTVKEFVSDIGNEAERLQRTTEKLLDLSRRDDGVFVAPEPVDVKQVTIDALALLKPLADERRVHIHCALEDGSVVMATTDDMFHIVFNLMENAVKYNVEGGSVNVSLSSNGEKVTLAVSDTGIGIPEEDRLNIFSRFYRVDKARSREAGGSGLGLSIVHDAVIAHKGSITVGQNKPQGTVFTVTLPRPSSEETGI